MYEEIRKLKITAICYFIASFCFFISAITGFFAGRSMTSGLFLGGVTLILATVNFLRMNQKVREFDGENPIVEME